MNSNVEGARSLFMGDCCAVTRQKTRLAISGIDPDRVAHDDDPAWRIRDVVGRLGVWNGEAVSSLHAHAKGGGFIAEEKYDEYNGLAVDTRRNWNMDRFGQFMRHRMTNSSCSWRQCQPKNGISRCCIPGIKGVHAVLDRSDRNNIDVEHREIILAG